MNGQTGDSDSLRGSPACGVLGAPQIILTAKAFQGKPVNQRVKLRVSTQVDAVPRCHAGTHAVEMPIRGLSAAYESFAFCKHRSAADKRYSLAVSNRVRNKLYLPSVEP